MNLKEAGKLVRGTIAMLLGIGLMTLQIGCNAGKVGRQSVTEEGEQVIYNADSCKVIQGKAVHKGGGSEAREYIFVPLTFRNMGDNNIIFSSSACIKAYALPSGEACQAADRGAIASAKENLKDFALFDGIIHGNEDTRAWLVFEAPKGTEQICVDFFTGSGEKDYISFNCKV